MFDDWELRNDHPVNIKWKLSQKDWRTAGMNRRITSKQGEGRMERCYRVRIDLRVVPYRFQPSSAFGPGISDTVVEVREFPATNDITATSRAREIAEDIAETLKGAVRSVELCEIIQPMIPEKLRSVSFT